MPSPSGTAITFITIHVGWVELAISTIGLSQHISRVHDSVDEPIVQTLRRNFVGFTGREPDQIGAVVSQSYAGNDSCHILEAGIPCCLYGPPAGRDQLGEPDAFVDVSSMVRCAQVTALTALDWCNQTD